MNQDGDSAAGPAEDGCSIITVTLPEVARREHPRTRITVESAFAIGRTEVTID